MLLFGVIPYLYEFINTMVFSFTKLQRSGATDQWNFHKIPPQNDLSQNAEISRLHLGFDHEMNRNEVVFLPPNIRGKYAAL